MAQNTASPDSHEIPLTVLGGLVTFIDPTSLPMGVSPDCSDMQFSPGGTSSRDGFDKYFASPLYPTAVRTYSKSYVDPKGTIFNLYFYSNGALTVENVTTTPGVETLLSQTSALGAWAKSCTAFGREYIAISDTLHGAEIPLQFDGTNLDRVTQDGPGTSPNVASVGLPSVAMVASGAPVVLNLAESDPAGGDGSGYFTAINMYTADSVASVNVGDQITIAGYGGASAPMNGTWPVLAIFTATPNNLVQLSAYLPPTTVFSIAAATGTVGGGTTIQRVNNIVTVTTAVAHQLQSGYQAQITGVPAATVGSSISTVVVNNENLPGLATVTTAAAHGLVPGLNVSLLGIVGASVGGGISTIVRNGQVVTVTTVTANGLNPGAIITIAGVTTTSFNTIATVQNVVSSTVFTYLQVDVDAADTTGTITLNWPIFNTPTPSYFVVVSAPTTTTFQIELNYSDGAWSGGTVTYAWNGTFFVKDILSSTSFTYLQYGPNATSSTVGKVTPYGQAAPGKRQMVCFFITRQGYTTRYSPPVSVVTNGGQYLSVTNIPIGPSNVVARVLAFTGSEGAYFYYIPAPPQVNGQLVGTATVINDNTTTSTTLDFSDPTLFAGLGISIAGNNLANQTIIDGALGFARYASRLITYGQRNTIQNLLNLGFDGGYLPATPTFPTGWSVFQAPGILVSGHYGSGFRFSVAPGPAAGNLYQSAYEDFSGAPIVTPLTNYRVRAWLKPSAIHADVNFHVSIQSGTLSFFSIAVINGVAMKTAGSWLEADFALPMPAAIPSDMLVAIYADSTVSTITLIVDEISIIYADTPYANTLLGSYVNNPEAFDGVSGRFGPVDDTHQTLALGIIRSNLYLLTRDPGGRMHQTSQGNTEPSGWTVDEVGQNCGTVSAFSLTVSQANDDTGGGGEEWFAWYSSAGPRIFGGEFPFKIAQEIMRRKGRVPPGSPDDLSNINTAAQTTVWGLNDPIAKIMYFGVPMNAATAPNKIWMLSYLGCETAGEIASQDPVHRAPNTGKMTANDLGRKWSPWNRPMNSAALMFSSDGELQPFFCGGSGQAPATLSGVVSTANIGSTGTSAVAWVSGDKFGSLTAGQPITVNGVSVVVLNVASSILISVTTALGTHASVAYSALPGPAYGNIYTLDPDLKTDDDFGVIVPYYTSSALPDPELAQGLGIGGGLKMCAYAYGLISGTGTMTLSIRFNLLSKLWRIVQTFAMNENPDNDTEWGCGEATGKRFWFRFASAPTTGTDNDFELNNWTVAIKKNPRMPVRGSNR